LGPIPFIDATGVLRVIAPIESAMDEPAAIANIQSEISSESKIPRLFPPHVIPNEPPSPHVILT
jgi:hypothetical protein